METSREKKKRLKKEYQENQKKSLDPKLPDYLQYDVTNLNEPFGEGLNIVVFKSLKSLLDWRRGHRVSAIVDDFEIGSNNKNRKKKIESIEHVLNPIVYIKKSKKSEWYEKFEELFILDEIEIKRYWEEVYVAKEQDRVTPEEMKEFEIVTLKDQREEALNIINRYNEEYFAICREEKKVTYA